MPLAWRRRARMAASNWRPCCSHWHGCARTHAGIAVVLTLASQADAFARQTSRLVELISTVRGEDVAEDTALGMAA